MKKQLLMMKAILHLYKKALEAVGKGIPVSAVVATGLFDKLTKMKYDIPNDKPEMFDDYMREIDRVIGGLS